MCLYKTSKCILEVLMLMVLIFILFFSIFQVIVQLLNCVWLCDPMNCSMPGFPVLHCLPEFAQTHVLESVMLSNHLILCHPLLLLPNLSQHQSLFQWVGSLHQVAKASASAPVLPMNIQGWFPLGLTGLTSLLSKRLSRVFSSTTIGRQQAGAQPL